MTRASLAEWSKAWDLSSHNRKIAWVRTPQLAEYFSNFSVSSTECFISQLDWLQWRNRLAHGTYRQYNELCRGCEFEPHLEQVLLGFRFDLSSKFIVDRSNEIGKLAPVIQQFLDSLVVRISACHVEGPGSIPGRGETFFQHEKEKLFWQKIVGS